MTSLPSGSSSPTTLSIAIATAILGVVAGYMLSAASSLNPSRSAPSSKPRKSWPNSYDVTVHPDSSDEELMAHLKSGKDVASAAESESDDEGAGGELKTFEDVAGECKLVLVVRTDLGMGKGKMAAQCSHATLACYRRLEHDPAGKKILRRWQGSGQAKVAVQCGSEEQLLTLQAQALSLGLCAQVIHDAGRTQIAAGSATVLGVGPAPKAAVDGVTGSLKLL